MTMFRNEGRWDTSNVLFDGGRVIRLRQARAEPEMRYIDYGLGLFSRGSTDPRNSNRSFDLAAVYEALAASGQLAGYEVIRRFYEFGTPGGLG